MRLLRNLTLHRQGAVEQRIAGEAGFLLTAEPEGVVVAADQEGLRNARERLAELLTECWAQSSAALVGGHTALWIAAVRDQVRTGKLPELYYFDVRRIQDAEGRFVFVPERLLHLDSSTGPASV